jgi:DNA-binding beta-propeller fold protein YncE
MKTLTLLGILAVSGCLIWIGFKPSTATVLEEEQAAMDEYRGTVHAPEFPSGIDWLNTDRPLSIRELRGKIVLLDFWTYCCINCIHIIPDLKRLEAKYPNELVVIGVHSAKFNTERETANIRQAILRYEIEHPVINDWEMTVWQLYHARAWPTLILIDPEGKIVGAKSGEGVFEPFDEAISRLIATFDKEGKLDRRPLNLKIERHRVPASLLSFPGKVLAHEATNRLFISDSNHNRIVAVSLADFSVKEIIGSGEIGMKDGSFDEASFNHPQGLALDGKNLYVADTENHTIRLVDLEKRSVTTIAGTGEQARDFNVPGTGRNVALNSPWDLLVHEGALYVAMAGPHQLWKLDLKTGFASPFAGSGREARIDGPLGSAALAQPSGITTDGKKLFFADSEVSSIRSADIDPTGRVDTLVGGDLFDFGDRDAKGLDARLQHPLGVVYHEGAVYVADTYNNKIKRINLKNNALETFAGTGEGGLKDGKKAAFDEPAGISLANGKLYVADTNNHLIRVVDLKTKQVGTLKIAGIEKLKPRFRGETQELPVQTVEPGDATLIVSLELPRGFKLNPQAPSFVKLSSGERQRLSFNGSAEQTLANSQFPVSVPVQVSEGQTNLSADFVLYYCEADKETLCFFKEARLRVPVRTRKGSGSKKLNVSYQIKTS